jgi:hypothetical protein
MRERHKEIFFIVFIVAIVALSAVYFSVPERVLFMEFQITWWRKFFSVLLSFIQ